jgi:hypothetical protein
VADVAAQAMGPDAEAAGAIEHTAAPGTLVDEPVGGTRIRECIQGRQRHLDQVRREHWERPPTQWRARAPNGWDLTLQPHHCVNRRRHEQRADVSTGHADVGRREFRKNGKMVAAARAQELGGRASPIMDSRAGPFSIVNDPNGAVFGIIKL